MKSEFHKSYSTDLFSDEDSGSIEVQIFLTLLRIRADVMVLLSPDPSTIENLHIVVDRASSLSKPAIEYTILLD